MDKIILGRIGGLILVLLVGSFFVGCEREREIDDRAGAPTAAVSPAR